MNHKSRSSQPSNGTYSEGPGKRKPPPTPEQLADAMLRASGGPRACGAYPFKFRLEEVAAREGARGSEANTAALSPEAGAILAAAHLTPDELGALLLTAATGHQQPVSRKARRKLSLAFGKVTGRLGARPAELMQPERRADGTCGCPPGHEACRASGLCPHRPYLWR